MYKVIFPLLFLFSALLGGCSIYKIDTQQGNVVTQEMIGRLKPGLDKRQVRYLLGTPLINDVFTRNRWDYYYSFRKGGSSTMQRRRITLIFNDDGKLIAINGDVKPGNRDTDTPKPMSARAD